MNFKKYLQWQLYVYYVLLSAILYVAVLLFTNIGFGQRRPESVGGNEPAVITVGDAADSLALFLRPGADSYSAADVLEILLADHPLPVPVNGACEADHACSCAAAALT